MVALVVVLDELVVEVFESMDHSYYMVVLVADLYELAEVVLVSQLDSGNRCMVV
jgi:hypothetical protein